MESREGNGIGYGAEVFKIIHLSKRWVLFLISSSSARVDQNILEGLNIFLAFLIGTMPQDCSHRYLDSNL
jgi:hypothetical protein